MIDFKFYLRDFAAFFNFINPSSRMDLGQAIFILSNPMPGSPKINPSSKKMPALLTLKSLNSLSESFKPLKSSHIKYVASVSVTAIITYMNQIV